MIRALVLISGLLGTLVWAEDPSTADPRQPQGNTIIIQQQQNQPGVPYRGVPIFSDDVFKAVGKEPVQPRTSKGASGTTRVMDDDANYNTEQRRRWIKNCSPQKAQDPRLYRECYESARDKELQSVKAAQEAVEARQGQPLRNTQANPIRDAEGAASAFGRADVETESRGDGPAEND